MDINSILVRPNDALLDVIKTMDRAHLGLAVIVDGEGRLVGIMADRDIRWALIQGVDLNEPIQTIMTSDPLFVREGASDSEIICLLQNQAFKKREPVLIPAVDNEGRPVRLYRSIDLINNVNFSENAERFIPKPDKILVIGGAGYIGSVLVRSLLGSGYQVTVLDSLLYGDTSIRDLSQYPQFELIRGDTRHIDELVPVIRKSNAVVHLAELVGDPLCGQDPQTTFEINYLATSSISRICSYLQINRFLYMSSCSVYGASESPDAILDEDSNLAPVSLYARTKINSERVILGMANGNFSPCIFRLGTVFGPSYRPRFDLVVNTLTAKAVQENEIHIFGGSQWRPHVHVADVARAIRMALERPIEDVRNQIFNIVGENRKIDEIGKIVYEAIPGIKVVQKDTVLDIRNYTVSGDKAAKILGFKPRKKVVDGVLEIAEELKTGKIEDYKDERFHNNLLSLEHEDTEV